MSRSTSRLFGHLVVCTLAASLLDSFLARGSSAAEELKAGESVEVFFLNKWWPAVVVDTNPRGEVLAEFEFAGGPKRQVFKKNEVRFPYEADALSKGRQWSDASGKFRIRAALLAISGDRVTLRKQDMSELEVPISKLSDTDQRFIKSLEKEAGPGGGRAPQPPAVEQFAVGQGSHSWGVSPGNETQRASLAPDPLPGYLKLTQGGLGFPTDDFADRIGAVLPIGGPDAWLLAAVEDPRQERPTRLIWVSLKRQKIEGKQLLPPGEIVLDYHAPSHRLLTYALLKGAGDPWGSPVLTLWEVLPTDKQVNPIVRWNANPDKDRPHTPWARLVDGDTVVHRWKSHDLAIWDSKGKQMRYQTNQEAFFAPSPTLSGGRKYLFIPEDKQVRILESATGQPVGALPVDDGAAAVAVSEDGRQAAVLGRSTLTVWDLTQADTEPQRYQAEAIGTPFQTTLSWLGEQRLMAEAGVGLVLFSLPHELALWSYEFDMSAIGKFDGRRVREIVAGHLVYAASVQAGMQRGLAVGAVTLPGPKVEEIASSLDRQSLMVIKRGTPVRLEVSAGGDTARVTEVLTREIQANGWEIRPTAAAVVIAEMKRGETQQVTYRKFGGGDEQTATVTPFISAVRVEVGGKTAWQASTSTGAPLSVRLKEGQTAQGEVDRWQHPDVEFFDRVDMPEEILDPTKKDGVGTTQVTNRGLIPK